MSLTSSLADAQHPAALASGVEYNAFGEPVSIAMGNGLTEATSFDIRGRMTGRSAGSVYALSGIQHASDGDVLAAQRLNKMAEDAAKAAGLDREQADRLHRMLDRGQLLAEEAHRFNFQEIKQLALEIARGIR